MKPPLSALAQTDATRPAPGEQQTGTRSRRVAIVSSSRSHIRNPPGLRAARMPSYRAPRPLLRQAGRCLTAGECPPDRDRSRGGAARHAELEEPRAATRAVGTVISRIESAICANGNQLVVSCSLRYVIFTRCRSITKGSPAWSWSRQLHCGRNLRWPGRWQVQGSRGPYSAALRGEIGLVLTCPGGAARLPGSCPARLPGKGSRDPRDERRLEECPLVGVEPTASRARGHATAPDPVRPG